MLSRITASLLLSAVVFLSSHGQVITAPYYENFQGSGWVGHSAQSVTGANIGVIAPGWSRSPNTTTGMTWAVLWGDPPNYNGNFWGPEGGAPYFFGNYLGFRHASNLSGTNSASITSPQIVTSNLTSPYLQFFYHRNGVGLPDVKVEVNDGSGWQVVFTENTRTHFSRTDLYSPFGTSLSSFGDTIQVRFVATNTGSTLITTVFDDFRVIEEPTCGFVDGMEVKLQTDTTAIATWNPVPGAVNYWIYLKKESDWPYVPRPKYLVDTVATNSAILTGLEPSETYEYFVQPVCGQTDTGEARGPVPFETPECGHFTTLFYDPLTQWQKACWLPKSNDGFKIYSTGGRDYLKAHVTTAWDDDSAYIQSPIIKLAGNDRLKFSWSKYNYSTRDTLKVFVRNIGDEHWDRLMIKHSADLEDPTSTNFSLPGNFIEESIALPSIYANELVEFALVYKVELLQSPGLFLKDFIVEDSYATDLKILSASLLSGSECSSANDSLQVEVENVMGGAYQLNSDPLQIEYQISGQIPQSGTAVFSTGSVASGGTRTFTITGLDFSETGVYSLDFVKIRSNNFNQSVLNDTLLNPASTKEVISGLELTPDSMMVVTNNTDSVELSVVSKFFFSGSFFISEICHFKTTAGAPAGGWPTYMTGDDYIEISGSPGEDLDGFQLETWSATGLLGTITFNQGTVLSPDGTAIIGLGSGAVTSTADYFYAYYLSGIETVSTESRGRVLKDPSGVIIDAVGYSGNVAFAFPAASNVTTQQWSGQTPFAGGTSGIRLIGPDLSQGADWYSCVDSIQDPNILNQGLQVGPTDVDSLTWYHNGQIISHSPKVYVGPFAGSGIYRYPVEYYADCGVYRDTATIMVSIVNPNCAGPVQFNTSNITCSSAGVVWNGGSGPYLLSVGPAPHIPMDIDSVLTVRGLMLENLLPATEYEVWVRSVCGSDTSAFVSYNFTTDSVPLPIADFNVVSNQSGGQYNVYLDGSYSSNASSYRWYNGSAFIGTGASATLTLSSQQPITVSLVVDNDCGSDSLSYTVANISIDEVEVSSEKVLRVFPNPTENELNYVVDGWEGAVEAVLMDASGREVFRTRDTALDVTSLPSGLYILRVSTSQEVLVEKVLIQ